MDLDLENINYIKFKYLSKNGEFAVLKGVIKDISTKDLIVLVKSETKILLNTPQNVELNFVCDNGLYKTVTELKYVSNSHEYALFSFKRPMELYYKQERGYFRVKLDKDAILSFKKNNETTRIPAKVQDISASGVKVNLKISVDIPKEVSINILFDNKEIKSDAQFVRIENNDDSINIAFEFKNIDEKNQDIIAKECLQKQIEDKRKKQNS